MGQQGENTKNDNGRRLIDLCVGNDLVITNTKFMHKEIHKYTREVRSRNEKSIIDYFIVNTKNWNRGEDVRVKRNAEIGSDHSLLKMELWTNAKDKDEIKRKIIVKQKIKSYRLKESEIQKIYQESLEKKIAQN
ncbi:hypothetical protein RN001_007224 [Aquatica leii]|uniref:Endonuclease/exonuclease/phosphatase domain-containing protein n=1 Tax=Aquatica leii TaxID=1421715 RepID=A0AAN7QI69_9COLE|nr:hypothetical protein RN001_007224 [Aquatica leii]